MGFSLKELIRAIALTRLLPASPQPPLPAAFPSPLGCLLRGHAAFTALPVLLGCPTTRRASLPTSLSLIGSLILTPLRNPASPPGVTLKSSVPCRPHTPWYDGWMSYAFASIVQARPCPIFGRPVHHGISPSIAARYFSSCPSDSTSRWTPCPPVALGTVLLALIACRFFGQLVSPRFQASASVSRTLDT